MDHLIFKIIRDHAEAKNGEEDDKYAENGKLNAKVVKEMFNKLTLG